MGIDNGWMVDREMAKPTRKEETEWGSTKHGNLAKIRGADQKA